MCIASVLVHPCYNHLRLALSQKMPAFGGFVIWKSDKGEIADDANTAGHYTFDDEDPPPTS
jgi:hypothetical protein